MIAVLAAALLFQPQASISIEEYEPKSTLVVPQHTITRAKYPFIDIHTHHRQINPDELAKLRAEMDKMNMRIMVNSLPMGGSGEWLKNAVATMRVFNKDRFATMASIGNWRLAGQPGGPEKLAAQLEDDIRNGAVGLKIWKNFGMTEKDADGKRIPVDDPRMDPVWAVCARHKIPVLIHTADPKPLFEPMDKYNERWLELKMRPTRAHPDVSWDQVMAEQHHLFESHKDTIFIDAHMGWMANDLGKLGALLDRCPNVYVEIGAIYSELGRQPRNARAFFTKYQDRVLFGKDAWNPSEYPFVFRLLESADEYFEPLRRYHGLWRMYGLELPDAVLKKLYYKNAVRIVPGLSKAGFPD
ncbi:MAG TPA: amidohydrolase family protein [Bryobacteraceae bacterium]|nr:amidohydrolase family protein [Bryobacteraceae bacterium]